MHRDHTTNFTTNNLCYSPTYEDDNLFYKNTNHSLIAIGGLNL